MEKIALITDSAADLNEEVVNKYNINVLPFRIIYKDKEFKDGVDITSSEVYENLDREIPTSSLPSMQDMEDMFTRLEQEGYTHAIVVVISSGLSGIYNAIKLVSENHEKITTYIYDSKSISAGEGILIKRCGEMIEQNKTFDEITKEIDNIRKKSHLFFIVGTLEYLKKGGRIGKVAGTIGELLNIKPIIAIDENDGKYYTKSKVRGRKQSLNKLLEFAEEILKEKKCMVYVLHGNALEEAKKLCEKLSNFKNAIKVVFDGGISPVAGAHSGPGLIGVLLIEES